MSLRIVFFICLLAFGGCEMVARTITIMIDPAGDAKHAGRIIEDSFERGITLQFAEKLKKNLEFQDPDLRVILTRFPGESLEPLQNANFANRLHVDVYLSIHFYYEREIKPHAFLFYFLNSPTDAWPKQCLSNLCMKPYDVIHIDYLATTKKCAEIMKKSLSDVQFNQFFDVRPVCGIPFKPLVGIACPTFAFEGGLKTKEQWIVYLEPLMRGLLQIIKHIQVTS